ncbi:F-box domain-containing protein [Mycena indigotica]|uniref:F-box domain-containing protein n=1 Tax=Mycena indigotica TaxID=2126181 RepID=A0A8H6T7Z7_9AGAR|nr:F-box domain-containing protein [Mycena indigotica]KAF7311891.1 F-box domain-containing protein [Mycena indigotica]
MFAFPAEILTEIGSHLDPSSQRTARLTSRALNAALEPLVLRLFPLNVHLLSKSGALELMADIVAGRSNWPRYAKTLQVLRRWDPKQGMAPEDEDVVKAKAAMLAQVLERMSGMRSIYWCIRDRDFVWMHTAVQGALMSFPMLENLDVQIMKPEILAVNIAAIRNLKTLTVTAYPTLYSEEVTSIEKQAAMVVAQSPGLVSLHLMHRDYDCVWTSLPADIPLTTLHTDSVTPGLLRYLASHSGMTDVDLYVHANSAAAANALAATFFAAVLPRHAPTLVSLAFRSSYESHWSIGPQSIDVFRDLHLPRLTHLNVTVNKADLVDAAAEHNAVAMALNLIPRLPALKMLQIGYSSSEGTRRARCGNPRLMHGRTMRDAISTAVADFRTETDAGFAGVELRAWGSPSGVYELAPVPSASDGEAGPAWGFVARPLTPEQEAIAKQVAPAVFLC